MANASVIAGLVTLALALTACELKDRSPSSITEVPSAPTLPPDKPAVSDPATPEDGFVVAGHFPQAGDTHIALVSPIIVSFNQPALEHSYEDDLLTLSANGLPVPGTSQWIDASTLQFRPSSPLQPNTRHRARINGEAMSAAGQPLEPIVWEFQTAADVSTTPQDIIDQCMSPMDIAMLAAVNDARSRARDCGEDSMAAVSKLTWSCDLQLSAVKHAMDMAGNDFFSHTGSDGSTIGDRVSRANYVWSWVGENIAAGQRSVEDVMQGWIESPGHCRNIMSPNFTELGAGLSTSNDSFYGRYWAQTFARPR